MEPSQLVYQWSVFLLFSFLVSAELFKLSCLLAVKSGHFLFGQERRGYLESSFPFSRFIVHLNALFGMVGFQIELLSHLKARELAKMSTHEL